jgi:release factor glutamine methyltransferase
MHTVRQAIDKGTQELQRACIERAASDARLILQYLMGIEHAALILRSDEIIDAELLHAFEAAIERRVQHEPVSRIFGVREFFGSRFEIGPAVLDPRPESELLVEHPLRDFGDRQAPFFCDVGAGSGAIGISLLKAMPYSRCIALDISTEALEIASRNAEAHRVNNRWHGVCSDYFAGIDVRFDFIVANPPYIVRGSIPSLPPEVRKYDPDIALDGGEDGLRAYRIILAGAAGRLSHNGRLYLEIGAGQEPGCLDIAAAFGWNHIGTVVDLGAIPRLIILESALADKHFDKIKYGRRKCLEFDCEQASFTGVRGRHFESRP